MCVSTKRYNCGCNSGSGMSAETILSTSSAVWGLSASAKMTSTWACGKPLFWNSTTHVCATTLSKIFSCVMQRKSFFSFAWKTRATKSSLLAAVSPGRKFCWISFQLGLAVIVTNKSGLPKRATRAMLSRYDWCKALGLPPNVAGRITGVPTVPV